MSTTTNVMTREQMYADTERDILDVMIGQVNSEDLFWTRVDIGMDYLVNLHGEWKARKIWRKRSFWTWFLQTWNVNDKKILHEMRELGVNKISLDEYTDVQHTRMMRWKINEKVL